MKTMRYILIIAAAGFIVQFCKAADRHPGLSELSGFMVIVEKTPSLLQGTGLTSADVKERIELTCRKNALPVKADGIPFLHCSIAAVPVRLGGREAGFAYVISLDFYQPMKTLVSGAHDFIISWQAQARLGVTARETLRQEIKDDLQAQVEKFANVWLASHEK